MPIELRDARVQIIVTLRRNGVGDDEIAAVTTLYDSVDAKSQAVLAQLVTFENPEVVAALVQILPDVRAALLKRGGKSVEQIVEEAAKPFMPA